MNFVEAANRIDRCLASARVHQRMDCLRQDLIQEVLSVYERGIKDERIVQAESPCRCQKKAPKTER